MAPRVEQNDDITVVHPGKSLTAGTVENFQRTVKDEIAAGRRRLVVDMSETEAVDSAGLGALVRLQRGAGEGGGRLALVNLRENSQILLKLTQLESVLEAYDGHDEARRAFESPRPEPAPESSAAESSPAE